MPNGGWGGRQAALKLKEGNSFVWDSGNWTPEGPSVPCASRAEARGPQRCSWLSLGGQLRPRATGGRPAVLSLPGHPVLTAPQPPQPAQGLPGSHWKETGSEVLPGRAQLSRRVERGTWQARERDPSSPKRPLPRVVSPAHDASQPRWFYQRRPRPVPSSGRRPPRATLTAGSFSVLRTAHCAAPFGCPRRTFLGATGWQCPLLGPLRVWVGPREQRIQPV